MRNDSRRRLPGNEPCRCASTPTGKGKMRTLSARPKCDCCGRPRLCFCGFGRKDRKSTRLNSSHGYISYAVFCLKKKKKQKNELLPVQIVIPDNRHNEGLYY